MTELGKAAIEIVLMAGMIYAILWFVRRTTGAEILQGAAFFFAVALVAIAVTADVLGLRQLHFLFEKISGIFMIALLIGLQPEIRRGLMRLGAATTNRSARASVIRELTTALNTLSRLKIGALIAIENGVGLQNYIERTPGQLDAIVSAQLLETIFQPGTPLHDGGVIIRGDRIVAAGAFFPLTMNLQISTRLGTRHRAGVGLSEDTDALVLIVSEETGAISVAEKGQLEWNLSAEALEARLRRFYTETLNVERPAEAARA
jgi:diadenylate cyclase